MVDAKAERDQALPKLWDAIVAHTATDSTFWLGEILLAEITKETGYSGQRHRNAGTAFPAAKQGN